MCKNWYQKSSKNFLRETVKTLVYVTTHYCIRINNLRNKMHLTPWKGSLTNPKRLRRLSNQIA